VISVEIGANIRPVVQRVEDLGRLADIKFMHAVQRRVASCCSRRKTGRGQARVATILQANRGNDTL
jgi:hypothetical protein